MLSLLLHYSFAVKKPLDIALWYKTAYVLYGLKEIKGLINCASGTKNRGGLEKCIEYEQKLPYLGKHYDAFAIKILTIRQL